MNAFKSNFLLFSQDRCTGCKSCEMICSLHKTGTECSREKSCINVNTHPYFYSSLISVNMDCNCKDGKEMCVDACPEDAILFLPKTDAPGMLKDKEWLPGSIVDSVKTG